ncbi:unnamed protein product [Cuscuta campestris]|uniref:Uncharacterized protein n=1 Tax=Cuscuta campestris TaxID=132261 RepID=A0A484K9Z8_9ASTE|nr:unnamed protein product [Cuscuta campestris]
MTEIASIRNTEDGLNSVEVGSLGRWPQTQDRRPSCARLNLTDQALQPPERWPVSMFNTINQLTLFTN